MRIPSFDLSRQTAGLRDEIDEAMSAVVSSGRFISASEGAAFEEEAASYCGRKYGIGVASGTDALLLSLQALGIGPGDEVITSDWSFFASAEVIVRLGATPVLLAPDPVTFNMDVSLLEEAVSARTKAIIPVHLYGQMADMTSLAEFAERHHLRIVEDACQAFGATWSDAKAGSLGDAGCFSFYPTKNLGGFGDGGLVVTDDERLAQRIRSLRQHGMGAQKYVHHDVGYTSRLDELQAAVLRVKLPHVDAWEQRRREIAQLYSESLSPLPGVTLPSCDRRASHVYHQFVIRAQERDSVRRRLAEAGIGSEVYYPRPLHEQPTFAGVRVLGPEVGRELAHEVLALPMFPELRDEEVLEVCSLISAGFRR